MALWGKLNELPEDVKLTVHSLYGEHFPIVLRATLAQWIEEQAWNSLDIDDPQHEMYAKNLVSTLLNQIQAKANSEENLVQRIQLSECYKYFTQHYAHNPFILINIIRNCLQNEMRIIQQAEKDMIQVDHDIKLNQEIDQILVDSRANIQDSEEERKQMQHEQEQFFLQYQEFTKRSTYLQQQQANINGTSPNPSINVEALAKVQKEKDQLDTSLRQRGANLMNMRSKWLEKQYEIYQALQLLQNRVLNDELLRWRRGQQLSGNGLPFDISLDRIQEWCELLAELTWQLRVQVERVDSLCRQLPLNASNSFIDSLKSFREEITSLLSTLIRNTFIIERQPPQVMKTNTRFTSTVRLLVGGKLNVHMTPPTVKASIISEAQANNLIKNEELSMRETSGDIVNNSAQMEYHTASRQLTVNFRNMQLKKIKRAEKKGTESVMDEKFSLLFQTEFKIGNGDLPFKIWTLSLPVVVIVHGNQEPHAWATVTWDNAFAEPGRLPFVVPDKVPWQRVGEVLNMKFKAFVGRELTIDNLRFLAGKAFRNTQIQDYDQIPLSWQYFAKDSLPDRSFTFWEWFYAILKVTKEHLRSQWTDGLVIGFIGRKQTEEMLMQKPSGTFLLRYSDSELGGITIAWHAENQESNDIFMLQPFTSRDFNIRGLSDRINDLKNLLYLYPSIPKDQAFGKYYTPLNENQPQPNGYIRPVLVTHIPGFAGSSSFESSYPNTPQSTLHNPNSPGEGLYIDNPASVRSSSTDHVMNVGAQLLPDVDNYNDFYMNMDLTDLTEGNVDFQINDMLT